ncbi:MAG: exosortase/archaeosortase family protein [Candidatus Bathyarchaeia archaeon]
MAKFTHIRSEHETIKEPNEKPKFAHALVLTCIAVAIAVFLASGHAWNLTAKIVAEILKASGVDVNYVAPLYLMYVKVPEGKVVGFQVLVECSGLLTLVIFAFLSVFTIGLLRGSLKYKILWFCLSAGIGFVWNVSRLASIIITANAFGMSAFTFIHYVLAPTIDFVWVVSAWAIGMTWLRRETKE